MHDHVCSLEKVKVFWSQDPKPRHQHVITVVSRMSILSVIDSRAVPLGKMSLLQKSCLAQHS